MQQLARKIIVPALLLVASVNTFAIGGDHCIGSTCYFGSINIFHTDHKVQYYCNAVGDLSIVKFQNHNVKITGFNVNNPDAGSLTLTGQDQVDRLNTHYFEASFDKDHNGLIKAVDVSDKQGSGSVDCHIGKRGTLYPGAPGR